MFSLKPPRHISTLPWGRAGVGREIFRWGVGGVALCVGFVCGVHVRGGIVLWEWGRGKRGNDGSGLSSRVDGCGVPHLGSGVPRGCCVGGVWGGGGVVGA